jgi:hypothetical protein
MNHAVWSLSTPRDTSVTNSSFLLNRIVEFKEARRKAALLREQHNALIAKAQEETEVRLVRMRCASHLSHLAAKSQSPGTLPLRPLALHTHDT